MWFVAGDLVLAGASCLSRAALSRGVSGRRLEDVGVVWLLGRVDIGVRLVSCWMAESSECYGARCCIVHVDAGSYIPGGRQPGRRWKQ